MAYGIILGNDSGLRGWLLALTALTVSGCHGVQPLNRLESRFPDAVERIWVGPELWANRLQDWRIANRRLECMEGSTDLPMRTVHLLTRRAGDQNGSIEIAVTTGPVGGRERLSPDSKTGFLVGVGGGMDYRAAALVHHRLGPGGGLFAGVDGEGRLFVEDSTAEEELTHRSPTIAPFESVRLTLSVVPSGRGYRLTLTAKDPQSGRTWARLVMRRIERNRVVGNLALVSHPGSTSNVREGARFWFDDLDVYGDKLEVHEDRTAGPILSTQYTLSRSVLKMTAQLMPVGDTDRGQVFLETLEGDTWRLASTADIVVPGFTATFRVENWDSSKDTPYRVRYEIRETQAARTYDYQGMIRRDPVDQDTIALAAFTGNHNLEADERGADTGRFPWAERMWFPHRELTERVTLQNPDLLFFSGDQVGEMAALTPPRTSPSEKAELDYLYRWYLWCWAFRDLTRDRPTVAISDDHDVFQRNLWGAGGRPAETEDQGGYVMPADWVNMVQRTQTAHLPDPVDATPVEQGITVYYTDLHYGRVSFAILEDRKFKSGPDRVVDRGFHPTSAGAAEATLLGARQLDFLEAWASDWRDTDTKAVLSQSVFADVARQNGSDRTRPVADYSSNGWPQAGRNEALRKIRKAFAVHISGGQQVGTLIHHGVDDWEDAGVAFGVPPIARPDTATRSSRKPDENREKDVPAPTGRSFDGWGNRITVYAVAHPGEPTGGEPAALYDPMAGYGIVRFNKKDRTTTFECWPRYGEPGQAAQYPGWPKTFPLEDHYRRKPLAYLSTIEVRGMTNPVVQVFKGSRSHQELVYALRIQGSTFRPWIYEYASYTVRVGEPGTSRMRTILGMSPLPQGVIRTILVEF